MTRRRSPLKSPTVLAIGGMLLVAAGLVVLVAALSSAPSSPSTRPPVVSPSPAPKTPSTRFFSPDSVWNAPVPADASLDPNSAAIVANLVQQEQSESVGIATRDFGVPIYTVPADQPDVHVTLDQGHGNGPLQRALDEVPIPASAQAAAGTDANLAVYQPSTDTMWEFWKLSKQADGWHARWGGRMVHVSTNPGYYRNVVDPNGNVLEQPDWGAPATSFPVVAGVMTIAELESGQIDHALALAITHTRAGVWAWPAQRTDGDSSDPNTPPEGAHFRLDPNLNLAALHLPHFVYMMAVAAQRYGIIIDNRSTGFTFRGEDPLQFEQQYGYNPYMGRKGAPGSPGALFNNWPPEMLREFPWSHLQLLTMNLRSSPDRTQVVESAPQTG
jgi:hypothetical protein